MFRPVRTDAQARHCPLSVDYSPCGVWGITSWSLLTLEQSGKGESLQTAFPLYILAEGRDIIDVKRIGVLMECSGAERRQNDNLLIPCAH